MDIFELLQEMYENKELHCRKKNLYSLKVRIKNLYESCIYAKHKAYNDIEWQCEYTARREALYNYLLALLDAGLIQDAKFNLLKNYLLK
jgi:hypothetical protein